MYIVDRAKWFELASLDGKVKRSRFNILRDALGLLPIVVSGKAVIIADTKFEFGLDKDQNLILIDEIFTPDCSRFWLYKNNEIDHNSFDKQFFRDYLTSIKWNNNQIQLPKDIKHSLLEKYQIAYNLITT